jgi:hypothetical protein
LVAINHPALLALPSFVHEDDVAHPELFVRNYVQGINPNTYVLCARGRFDVTRLIAPIFKIELFICIRTYSFLTYKTKKEPIFFQQQTKFYHKNKNKKTF